MEDQKHITNKGGTMRLGNYSCILQKGSKARDYYQVARVEERHRHRFEFNNDYRDDLSKHGLVFSGVSPDDKLVEIIELESHPFFIGSQFHPEFKSRPTKPHPIFRGFIEAIYKTQK